MSSLPSTSRFISSLSSLSSTSSFSMDSSFLTRDCVLLDTLEFLRGSLVGGPSLSVSSRSLMAPSGPTYITVSQDSSPVLEL